MKNCSIGEGVSIIQPCNIYGAMIDRDVFIGPFCEIQAGVRIGCRSRIQSHSFICEGVTIEADVFIGHGVVFTNDRYPKVANPDYKLERTRVCFHASIGSNATILPGITIGHHAMVGAGSVVTKNVPAHATVKGNPAR